MPGGRPRTFDPDDALDDIIDVLHRNGVNAASLNQVLRAADVAKPAVYAEFGDKERVIAAAIGRYAEELQARAASATRGASSPVAFATAFLGFYAEAFTNSTTPRGCLLATATCEFSGTDRGPVRAAIDEANARALAELVENLNRLGMPEPEAHARYLLGQTVVMSTAARNGATYDELDEFVDIAVRSFVQS